MTRKNVNDYLLAKYRPSEPERGVMSQREKIRLIKQRAKLQQKQQPSAFRKFLARLGGHRE